MNEKILLDELNEIKVSFAGFSSEIQTKMDEVSKKLDCLEKKVDLLRTKEIPNLDKEITAIKAKAGLAGAGSGGLIAALVAIIQYLLQHAN